MQFTNQSLPYSPNRRLVLRMLLKLAVRMKLKPRSYPPCHLDDLVAVLSPLSFLKLCSHWLRLQMLQRIAVDPNQLPLHLV